MRATEAIIAFVRGEYPAKTSGSVRATANGELKSYNATIAEHDGDRVVVHDGWDGYSPTTSKTFYQLHEALEAQDVPYEATHEPRKGNRTKDRWR